MELLNPEDIPCAIRELLEESALRYECADFNENDPISIPHLFSDRLDIEVAGFLTATISWGKRNLILRSARKLMLEMDYAPYDFVMHASEKDLEHLSGFVYRTFNGADLVAFIYGLRLIYQKGGLESYFSQGVEAGLSSFRNEFVSQMPSRSIKHVANVANGSTGKRLNMFLRWMVRSSSRGVDFGLWKSVTPAQLFLPLDVHTGNVSRALQLLKRKANDWRAVQEITSVLRTLDPADPVRYDFALFGMGVNEKTYSNGQ